MAKDYFTNAYKKLRPQILARANHVCEINIPGVCTHHATQVDHIHPRSKGGTNDPFNLRAACAECNQARKRTTPRTIPTYTTGRW